MYVRECGQDLAVVVCHLERMVAQHGRGRDLHTLWVELSVMLAYASLTDVDSHTVSWPVYHVPATTSHVHANLRP